LATFFLTPAELDDNPEVADLRTRKKHEEKQL